MQLTYRLATAQDTDALVSLRVQQLSDEGAAITPTLAPALNDFYLQHLQAQTFLSWLALDGAQIVGTSGMSFTEKPPYAQNLTGRVGLLSSMYTLPAYRRLGIAKALLARIMEEARARGCGVVYISASEMGAPLYLSCGFQKHERFFQFQF